VQLSTAIVFGLTFSTVLTLIVTPCALMLRQRFSNIKDGILGKFKRRKSKAEAQELA
jgi:multidrug efflux pump